MPSKYELSIFKRSSSLIVITNQLQEGCNLYPSEFRKLIYITWFKIRCNQIPFMIIDDLFYVMPCYICPLKPFWIVLVLHHRCN